jgi:hypothetical protein
VRRRRRRLLVALALLCVLFAAGVVALGEIVLRPTAERRIAEGLADELGLARRPSVHVDGFPIVLDALRQRVDGVDVDIAGETFSGLRVEQLSVHIRRVSFRTGEVLGGSGTIRVAGGDGEALITDADISAYLERAGVPVRVRFSPGRVTVTGTLTVAGSTATVSVSGPLELTGDTLRFTPSSLDLGPLAGIAGAGALAATQLGFTAPVPDLEGVRPTTVTVRDGVAAVAASLESLELRY